MTNKTEISIVIPVRNEAGNIDQLIKEIEKSLKSKNYEIIYESKMWHYYNLPKYLNEKLWKGRFIGQKQKWFIMRFVGNEDEINIKTKKPEFLDWKWIDIKDLTTKVVDFKLHVYQEIQKELEKVVN